MMIRTLSLVALTLPAVAQEPDQDVVGSVTASVDGEEMTFVVVPPGESPSSESPSSGFERRDGVVDVRIVARPDRTATERTPVLEIGFSVTGMGPTADATEATVSYTGPDGETLDTGEGAAEVSLTAYGMEEDEVTASGNFSSQLRADDEGLADLAIEGDFQASLRQVDFGETD